MPKVICTRPNASTNINGVNFTPTEDGTGVISDEISTEVAELFLSIDGYHQADESDEKPASPVKTTAPTKAHAAPTKAAATKKADKPAPAPARAHAPAPVAEGIAGAATGAADGNGADDVTTGSKDTAHGAGEGGGNDDHNVF